MARPLRIEYPGAFYHVISRGNGGDPIYKTRRDREKFLEYLAKTVERFAIYIHTFCLMTNHYHLLVETSEPNLSRAMQWLNVSYATYFNYKRDRRGHLFQGRFKSILVDADGYLKHLCVFRAIPATHSDRFRPLIPTDSGHRFQSIAAIDSD